MSAVCFQMDSAASNRHRQLLTGADHQIVSLDPTTFQQLKLARKRFTCDLIRGRAQFGVGKWDERVTYTRTIDLRAASSIQTKLNAYYVRLIQYLTVDWLISRPK